jgi:hypothetical protein
MPGIIDQNVLRSTLDKVAGSFTANVQRHPDHPDWEGWGQFLDLPRPHVQIGSYGTAASFLVLSLAGRADAISAANIRCINNLWQPSLDQGVGRLVAQNVRLAFLHLALRITRARRQIRSREIDDLYDLARTALLARVLPSGAWGDWWISSSNQDAQPNLLVTSIIVLSFSLLRGQAEPLPDQIHRAISYLDRELRGRGAAVGWPQSVAAVAALASVKGYDLERAIINIFRDISETLAQDLVYPLIHFYDFVFVTSRGNEEYGRDYFIAPRGVFIAIAGLYGQEASWRCALQANRLIPGYLEIIQTHNGLYKPDPDRYVSTLDQAWVSILLALCIDEGRPTRAVFRFIGWLTGPKPDNWIWSVLIPVVIIVLFIAGAWAFSPDGPIGAEYLSKFWSYIFSWICVAITAVAGEYFAPRIGRRVFPGFWP